MSELVQEEKICRVLRKVGLVNGAKITNTLQGSIWRASVQGNGSTSSDTKVIKITTVDNYNKSTAIINHKVYAIQEDILTEQRVLQYLTKHPKCPDSIVKFSRFFRTGTHFYFVMEDGGLSLFDFIQNSHKLIKDGFLPLSEWKRVVQILFCQMVGCIEFLHSLNICHTDVSLENFLINDVTVQITDFTDSQSNLEQQTVEFCTDDIQIKICDFGLVQIFEGDNFLSEKFVGKKVYKSPEVTNKQRYDAKKNDIWCLGVVLWMMSFGCPPWDSADSQDQLFNCTMNGYMLEVLTEWKLVPYADQHLIDLLKAIFKNESERITLDRIKTHPWISM